MKRLWFLMISVLFLLVACSGAKSEEKTEGTEARGKATEEMKTFRVGQIVDADGVDVRVVKAEYVNDYEDYEAPNNGKVLKVTLKFKNNNSDQVLVDSSAFTMNVRGETYPDWIGGDGTDGIFSHQLNQGKTATGTLTFDVPEAKVYTLEMDTYFKTANVKAKWNLHQAMIKDGSYNEADSQSDTKKDKTKAEDDSEDYPYTAEEYNALVDEYNALTDGERMNHVTRGVTNKEYNDLAARIDKLYDELEAEWDKEYQKQLEREDAEWQKNQDRIDKEFEAEMKRQDEIDAREEAQRQKQEEADQRAYEAEMKRQDEQAAREAQEQAKLDAELQKQEEAVDQAMLEE
ncbi:DUF4352 domain-containing protein [Staphylococcus simulans]|uniref:DUF4352 domain-containing protein n=1 Tax=Staphylococcus simulans TaxID=1286 RepID=UPI000F6F093F|nr:DUF4352 domain-containing protein [Staphylococcus simulans]VED59174.1 RNA binding protein [Staphylococcus simulans]